MPLFVPVPPGITQAASATPPASKATAVLRSNLTFPAPASVFAEVTGDGGQEERGASAGEAWRGLGGSAPGWHRVVAVPRRAARHGRLEDPARSARADNALIVFVSDSFHLQDKIRKST